MKEMYRSVISTFLHGRARRARFLNALVRGVRVFLYHNAKNQRARLAPTVVLLPLAKDVLLSRAEQHREHRSDDKREDKEQCIVQQVMKHLEYNRASDRADNPGAEGDSVKCPFHRFTRFLART